LEYTHPEVPTFKRQQCATQVSAYARRQASVNQFVTVDHSLDRSTTSNIQSDDSTNQANLALSTDTNFYAWNTLTDNSIAHTTLPILSPTLPRDNSCHHDSSANHHVFHDRNAFEVYKEIPPLTVKGFGKNLSTIAIGWGTIHLKGRYQNNKSSILLTNVLHIPAARTNLISGLQLNKVGVMSMLGNKLIYLSANNKIIVSRTVVNDMYHLDLTITPPNAASLASRLAPPPLTA
jgi:hypothetical protein